MEKEALHTRILIGAGFLLCAGIICYNVFFSPQIQMIAGEPPLVQQSEADNSKPPQMDADAEKIDLNEATKEELEDLPGVGEVIAQRILDYRNEIGTFESAEELKDVKGIGDKVFEELAPFIIISE